MKIGILTFHRAINYGAVLQCFALSEYLNSLGHDVRVIDYRPPYLGKHREGFNFKALINPNIKKTAKYTIWSLVNLKSRRRLTYSFDCFLKNNLQLTSPVYNVNDIPNDLDLIFFGSDQIWNPKICEGFDLVFWGQFKHENTHLATYAASIGRTDILTDKQLETIERYINAYDNISVREDKLRSFLIDRKLAFDVTTVVDPTQLLDRSFYDKIAKPPLHKGEYVLLISLEENMVAEDVALNVASRLDCRNVIKLVANKPLKRCSGITYVSGISPLEYLGWIKNARFVVCISFHAVSFSILFKKNFFCIKTKKWERAYNLLSICGLEQQMIKSSASSLNFKINYDGVQERLNQARKVSYDYISRVLDKQ